MKLHHLVAETLPGVPGREKEDTPSHALGMPAFGRKPPPRKAPAWPHDQSVVGHEMANILMCRRFP